MVEILFLFFFLSLFSYLVEESTEKLVNALHDAAKRGNIEFLQQSLANKVEKNEFYPNNELYLQSRHQFLVLIKQEILHFTGLVIQVIWIVFNYYCLCRYQLLIRR